MAVGPATRRSSPRSTFAWPSWTPSESGCVRGDGRRPPVRPAPYHWPPRRFRAHHSTHSPFSVIEATRVW